MQENHKHFELPQQLLNQLDEFSNGGFVLFRINQDDEVEHNIVADDPHRASSLMNYVRLFVEAGDEVSKDCMKMGSFYHLDDEIDGESPDSEDFSL